MGNGIWFVVLISIVWIMWFVSGGPNSGETDRPFLRPLAPIEDGTIYGPEDLIPTGSFIQRRDTEEEEEEKVSTPTDVSFFGGKVSFTFQGRFGAQLTRPQEEYIQITASKANDQPVKISDWVLKSAISGNNISIGEGSYLPYSGRVNAEDAIFLKPGETATIATGHSPIGVSFRINQCSGYFEQFQNFTPSLDQNCPYIENEEIPLGINGVTDACIDYLEDIPRCRTIITSLPLSLSGDPICQEFISKNANYNGCVALHKDDENFYSLNWRVYLSRDNEFWRNKRETILLLDESGKLVDSISY